MASPDMTETETLPILTHGQPAGTSPSIDSSDEDSGKGQGKGKGMSKDLTANVKDPKEETSSGPSTTNIRPPLFNQNLDTPPGISRNTLAPPPQQGPQPAPIRPPPAASTTSSTGTVFDLRPEYPSNALLLRSESFLHEIDSLIKDVENTLTPVKGIHIWYIGAAIFAFADVVLAVLAIVLGALTVNFVGLGSNKTGLILAVLHTVVSGLVALLKGSNLPVAVQSTHQSLLLLLSDLNYLHSTCYSCTDPTKTKSLAELEAAGYRDSRETVAEHAVHVSELAGLKKRWEDIAGQMGKIGGDAFTGMVNFVTPSAPKTSAPSAIKANEAANAASAGGATTDAAARGGVI